jgi:hypothetical protein
MARRIHWEVLVLALAAMMHAGVVTLLGALLCDLPHTRDLGENP